jgi:hypothetical protein
MQGVSGSNPLGSILRTFAPPGFSARRVFCYEPFSAEWAQKWAHFFRCPHGQDPARGQSDPGGLTRGDKWFIVQSLMHTSGKA